MDRICARCGCTSFHYSRTRMRTECDACGTPIYDAQQEQQQADYDRKYAQAMAHLSVGNWSRTIEFLVPYLDTYPARKELHLAILRAATKDFSDLGTMSALDRQYASEAWDKLVRLNSVTPEMRAYTRRRAETDRRKWAKKRSLILVWVFSAAFCAFVAAAFFETSHPWIAVLFVSGLCLCLKMAAAFHPDEVTRRLRQSSTDPRKNPFTEGGS